MTSNFSHFVPDGEVGPRRYTRGNSRDEVRTACYDMDLFPADSPLHIGAPFEMDRDVEELRSKLRDANVGSFSTLSSSSLLSTSDIPFSSSNDSLLGTDLTLSDASVLDTTSPSSSSSDPATSLSTSKNPKRLVRSLDELKSAFESHKNATAHFFDYFDEKHVLCYFHDNEPAKFSILNINEPWISRVICVDRLQEHIHASHNEKDPYFFPHFTLSQFIKYIENGFVAEEGGNNLCELIQKNIMLSAPTAEEHPDNVKYAERIKSLAREKYMNNKSRGAVLTNYFPLSKAKSPPVGLSGVEKAAINNGIAFCIDLIRNCLPLSLPSKLDGRVYMKVGKYSERDMDLFVNLLHEVSMDLLHKILHGAPGFSISFDGWTSRNCKHGYIGITYRIIDSKFIPHEFLLDYWKVSHDHTAFKVASGVSKRIESHSHSKQILFSSSTDGAAAVVKASKAICSLLTEVAEDVVEDIEVDEDDAEQDRALHCGAHLVQLSLKDFCVFHLWMVC